MPNSPGYVWEKMLNAVKGLCGSDPFEQRLADAGMALHTLRKDDLEGELRDDLLFVLKWTTDNMRGGSVQKIPDDLERSQLIDKMLHILLETDRLEQKLYGD